MQEARALLVTSLSSVKQIMLAVGFTDKGHFVRHFKDAFGETPSRYRARHLPLILAGEYVTRRNRNTG